MKAFLGIILLSLIFLYPLFHSGLYMSHDGENHVARFAAYFQALQDGHFPPRWAGNLNFGYGTPVLMFFYPLPGYLGSFLHSVGISYQEAFKMLMATSFIVAPIAFYFWARLLFRKEVALLGALLYGLAPYHFLNLYVRGDIGELIAFVFVPLVFLAIEKTIKTKRLLFSILGAIFYAFLILSHNGVSLMFSPVLFLYGVIRSKSKKILLYLLLLFIFGLLISAFFWIPALYEARYVNAKLFIGNMYKDHFPAIIDLFDPRWGFGTDLKQQRGLSPQLGLMYIAFVVGSLVLWFKEKKQKKMLTFWIVVFTAAVFVVLPFSDIFWKNIQTLRLYEFPWRFVGLASFSASVLACFVLEKIKNKKLLLGIFLILIFMSLPFIRVKEYFTRSEQYYSSFTGTTYYHGEASPIWAAGDPGTFAKRQIDIIGGKGIVTHVTKKTHQHEFTVKAENTVTILDNTLYFPGWRVSLDGQEIPIQFQDPNNRGLITFQVPEGNHTVRVIFTESKIRVLANMLSIIGIAVVVILFITTLLYNKK